MSACLKYILDLQVNLNVFLPSGLKHRCFYGNAICLTEKSFVLPNCSEKQQGLCHCGCSNTQHQCNFQSNSKQQKKRNSSNLSKHGYVNTHTHTHTELCLCWDFHDFLKQCVKCLCSFTRELNNVENWAVLETTQHHAACTKGRQF